MFRQLTIPRCYIRRDGDPKSWGSIVAARILMVLSASIIFTLGGIHLVYTFWGPKLTPRDPALQISMGGISPVITKAWFSVFSRWLTANSSLNHRSCLWPDWQCSVVGLCSARFIFSACLSQGSASRWPAMLPALRYRGRNTQSGPMSEIEISQRYIQSVRDGRSVKGLFP